MPALTTLTIFAVISLAIPLLLLLYTYYTQGVQRTPGTQEAYECGFPLVGSLQVPFSIRYILFAVLFVLFDLDIFFLVPAISSFDGLTTIGFWSLQTFLLLLIIGFIYEWRKGAFT